MRETSASEPLLKHRKNVSRHQNRGIPLVPRTAWRQPTYWLCGGRCAGGVTLIWAFVRNLRTWPGMPREKAQAAPAARPKGLMRRRGADSLVAAVTRSECPRGEG